MKAKVMPNLVFYNGSNTVALVNPNDRDWTRGRYVIAFGAYGHIQCVVWANSLEDALDEAADWLEENAPGMFCDTEVAEEYQRLVAEGVEESTAFERAAVDTMVIGAHHIPSWEVTVIAENPTRAEMLGILGQA